MYEFGFYQAADTVNPPTIATEAATSVDETFGVIHGNIVDDGGAPCQYRFNFGTDTNYGTDSVWSGNAVTGDDLGLMESSLTVGTTYHYRFQAQNSEGTIVSGNDMTFVAAAAPPYSWVLPDGFSDPDNVWLIAGNAFDDEVATPARSYHNIYADNWGSFLYLTRSAVACDMIRFNAKVVDGIDQAQVDVYVVQASQPATWVTVFNSSFTGGQWTTASFPVGVVTQARIRFHVADTNVGLYWELAEFAFHKPLEIGPGDFWNTVIAAASPGDTILVHNGVPAPIDINVPYQLNFAAYPGDAPVFDGTGTGDIGFIIADAADQSSYSGFTFQNYTNVALSSDGVPAVALSNCLFNNCALTLAVTVNASNVTIQNATYGIAGVNNCTFNNCTFNNLSQAGIVNCSGVTLNQVSFSNMIYCLTNVTGLAANSVSFSNATFGICGGSAIDLENTTVQNVTYTAYLIDSSTISNLTQQWTGSYTIGWSYILGYSTNTQLDNIQCNGLYYMVSNGENVTVSNSTGLNIVNDFAGCVNLTTENVTLTGGVMGYCQCNAIVADRNVISNFTTSYGEGFYFTDGDVTSSTFVGNNIVRAWLSDDLNFDSCIAWGNGTVSFGTESGIASYCLMQMDGTTINLDVGNLIGYLPRFVNQAGGDYHLLPNSPAIDTGDPALTVPANGGTRIDIGAFEYDQVADAARRRQSQSQQARAVSSRRPLSRDRYRWTRRPLRGPPAVRPLPRIIPAAAVSG